MAAPFAKALFIVLLAISGTSIHQALASEDPCDPYYLAMEHDHSIEHVLKVGDKTIWDKPCQNEQCSAIHDVACAYKALNGEYPAYTPGPGDNYLDTYLIEPHRELLQFIRSHHERRGLYCALFTQIAAQDNDNASIEYATTEWTIALATRITQPQTKLHRSSHGRVAANWSDAQRG